MKITEVKINQYQGNTWFEGSTKNEITDIFNLILDEINEMTRDYSSHSSAKSLINPDYDQTKNINEILLLDLNARSDNEKLKSMVSDTGPYAYKKQETSIFDKILEFIVKISEYLKSIFQEIRYNWKTEILPELFHRIIKQIIRKRTTGTSGLKLPFRFYYGLFHFFGLYLLRRETIDIISVGFQMNVIGANWLTRNDLYDLQALDNYLDDPEEFQNSLRKLKSLWIISNAQLKEQEDFEYNLNLILEE